MAHNWIRLKASTTGLTASSLNKIIKQVAGKAHKSITTAPELRQTIGQKYVQAVTPFVPMRTGKLRESGSATDDGRVYWTAVRRRKNSSANYAPIQYYTQYAHYTTEGTGPYWNTKVQPGTPEWSKFIDTIEEDIKTAIEKGVLK